VVEQTDKKSRRRLKPALTMRERAERATAQSDKPKRFSKLKKALAAPFRIIGNGLRQFAQLSIWKPVKFVGRIIGRVLFPPYLRSSWRELRMVTWPNGRQTRQLTGAVIAFSVIFGLFVAAFDYGLDKLFKQVILK
jgi:preprotein translocase SecE subunit